PAHPTTQAGRPAGAAGSSQPPPAGLPAGHEALSPPMANRTLIRQFDTPDIDEQIFQAFGNDQALFEGSWLPEDSQTFESNKIVTGKVREVRGEDVVIDIGYKSEGLVRLEEWREDGLDGVALPKAGDSGEVLLEAIEDES